MGQALQQGKAIALYVSDDGLGDGAVVQGVVDVVITYGFLGGIQDGQVDQHILLVEDFVLVDADKGAKAQVLDPDTRHAWLKLWHWLLAPSNQLQELHAGSVRLAKGAEHHRGVHG